MPLEQELATYRARLTELAPYEGKYALIHANDVIGTYATYEDALRQGYREFGLEPFMVKQVRSTEPVLFVSHSLSRSTFLDCGSRSIVVELAPVTPEFSQRDRGTR